MVESNFHPGKDNDAMLMLLVQEGDRKAFRQLVNKWKTPLVNYFYKHLGSQELAEDLAQEVFMKIWKTRRYVAKAPFSAWIWRMASNQLIDDVRSRKRRPPLNDTALQQDLSTTGNLPEDALLAAEDQHRLTTALQALPVKQRNILILSKFQDLKYQEIAHTLNCPVGQVKVQVFRAIQSLTKLLKEDTYES